MRKSPLAAFFFLAFLLSWLVAVPLALQRMGVLPARLPYSLHYLMAFGPMLSALAVVAATEGRVGLRGLLARGFRRRPNADSLRRCYCGRPIFRRSKRKRRGPSPRRFAPIRTSRCKWCWSRAAGRNGLGSNCCKS